MKVTHILMAAALLSALGLSPVLADDITADVLTYDGKTKVATAEGNVVIHANEGATITGSSGEYHFDDRTAHLAGGVSYEKEGMTMTCGEVFLYEDKTTRGIGNVVMNDPAEGRVLKGDDVLYNTDTGYGEINGNGYLESPDGSVRAPHIEGNLNQIKIEATGGVYFQSDRHDMTGYGDTAVYSRSGRNGTDGTLVLSGNAHATQNGNSFDGPELIMREADKIVETNGRSTLTITNTSSPGSTGGSAPSVSGPVTTDTPVEGKPDIPDMTAVKRD